MFSKNLMTLCVLVVMCINRTVYMDETDYDDDDFYYNKYSFMLERTPPIAEETNLEYLSQKIDDEKTNEYVSNLANHGMEDLVGHHARVIWDDRR